MNFLFAIPSSLLAAAIGGWIAGQRAGEPAGGASCAGMIVLIAGGLLGPIAIAPAFLCGVALAFCFNRSDATNKPQDDAESAMEIACPHCGRVVGASARVCPRCMKRLSTE